MGLYGTNSKLKNHKGAKDEILIFQEKVFPKGNKSK